MWRTNSLCNSANENLGTLAEYDPLTMHMMSKKELSSDELDTLRRSRNPTVVLTASGEVHTNEEAQIYVHGLNLFVTVQILEGTPAVLSLGKLCEDHGYSKEWAAVKTHG